MEGKTDYSHFSANYFFDQGFSPVFYGQAVLGNEKINFK
jgi:hypothetical protein